MRGPKEAETLAFEAMHDALRAVAEGTRLRILALLAETELTVSDLTEILRQSQPRISRHLKLLSEAGGLQLAIRIFFRVGHHDTDSPQPICLLRACHCRQGDGNSAKNSEQVAPPHARMPAIFTEAQDGIVPCRTSGLKGAGVRAADVRLGSKVRIADSGHNS